jgi:hypothetical protein
MARYRYFRCPDCGGTFKDLQVLSDDPPPNRCALCHAWMNMDLPPEEAFVPLAPGIKKSAYAQAVDQTHRATEKASIERSEEAAGLLADAYRAQNRANPQEGDRAILDDFEKNQIAELKSGLKITNMKDPSEMRPGDTAVIGPSADAAAQRLSIGPSAPGFQTFAGPPPNYAPGVGPAHAGEGARQMTNQWHAANAGAVVRAGQLAPAYKA